MKVKSTLLSCGQAAVRPFGFVLVPRSSETNLRMTSPNHADRLAGHLARISSTFLASNDALFQDVNPTQIFKYTQEFLTLIHQHPVTHDYGGAGFNSSYWIYLLTKIINPDLIIESGTFRGQSAWVFRSAKKDAELYCFDINMRNLEIPRDNINFIQQDWSTFDWSTRANRRHLVFFDDHVSQAQRILEAYSRGFTLLLFDDTLPSRLIYLAGKPPAPTVEMMFEDEIDDGEVFEWSYGGQKKRFVFDRALASAARDLIAVWVRIPDLHHVTGFRPQSNLCLVRLKSGSV